MIEISNTAQAYLRDLLAKQDTRTSVFGYS